ncbi:MAG: molybdate ABC transporter substrate-binding protein [Firmicutes bacterium]|nr:molybdate ABC transporter substrate-binding protein [Bacillota bacterium]
MKKKLSLILLFLAMLFIFAGCNSTEKTDDSTEPVTITIAVAASLKNTMDEEIIPAFQKQYPNIRVEATYDSSGKLQSQIEAGAVIDVFMSAATKQMTALNDKGLLLENSVVDLLENKIVLIVPTNSSNDINSFTNITKANNIGLGDPASVPAGQYGKEALVNLKLWDQISAKISLGTNVTQVLNWVAEGSADAGVVYATDAISNKNVKIVEEAPSESVSKVIYPLGIIKATENEESAKKFVEFLQTKDMLDIFVSYGFTAIN